MTIQEAAKLLLEEEGHPLRSTEIAKRALERGMVISNAKDPISSHAQTIEKNIRGGVYNTPKLVFIHTQDGRLIGLPPWDKYEQSPYQSKAPFVASIPRRKVYEVMIAAGVDEAVARDVSGYTTEPKTPSHINESKTLANPKIVSIKIPADLLEKIELAACAKIADTFEATVIYILKKGMSVVAPTIKKGLTRQLDDF